MDRDPLAARTVCSGRHSATKAAPAANQSAGLPDAGESNVPGWLSHTARFEEPVFPHLLAPSTRILQILSQDAQN